MTIPAGAAAVEQTVEGERPPARLVASFDGLGEGFEGPHGAATLRNPSDNSLAVGPDHIVQTVNSRMAIFSKQGRRFERTGDPLWGPVNTNHVFKDFGGACEARNNGDAVVRYDQLARRWLIVMPIFGRAEVRPDQPPVWTAAAAAYLSPPGVAGQPGTPARLADAPISTAAGPQRGRGAGPAAAPRPQGPYSMCYAISTGTDPFGPYYRYEFLRPLFPDYPRPAIWTDGYYLPTSTGDDVIQKHVCVAERERMLKGEPATEQCVVIDDVNFLNVADIDGVARPPDRAPAIVLATGGTQLKGVLQDAGLYAWTLRVDWQDPSQTAMAGAGRIEVAPYHYLCGGQLTNCVPQPGTDRRLDAQGDKLMSRLVYRRSGRTESIVGVHSVNATGGGGVRWYELRVRPDRTLGLEQQGTYAPGGRYRWMASPAIDRFGNIGIGYSYGGADAFAGQRFAGRLAADPKGTLTLGETVLVEGEAAQEAMRWEDYTQTAVDPDDDCTIWYVGDYLKKDRTNYSTRIGAFRMPGCDDQR